MGARLDQWWARYRVLILFSLSLIILLNVGFALGVMAGVGPIEQLYHDGLVVKIPSVGYAMIFAHGEYTTADVNGVHFIYHHMTLRDRGYVTHQYAADLRAQGYTRIWGSWCHTGDHEYALRAEYPDGSFQEIPWSPYVSRNTRPGTTTPVFVGLGFYRITGIERFTGAFA